MRLHMWIGGCAALLLATSCVADIAELDAQPEARVAPLAEPQILVDPTSGMDLTLRPNQKLNLKLTSNPTTGYYWYQTGGEVTVIMLTEETYVADPAPEGLTGSGGHQHFVFAAGVSGETELRLSYERGPDDVAETLSLNVRITE